MAKTTYMWDELSDNVAVEYDDGVLSAVYTHEPGLYGNLLSQNRNGVTSYYHYDGLGNTVALTDDSGNVTDTKEYDAWGNIIVSTGSTVVPYQFGGRQGYRSDAITSGYFARTRQYWPQTSRWLSRDSLWPIDHVNPYVYCQLIPLTLSDPSGENCVACCCCPDSLTYLQASLTTTHAVQLPDDIVFGHYFEIAARVSLLPSDTKSGSPCSVQWWENTLHSPADTESRSQPLSRWCLV